MPIAGLTAAQLASGTGSTSTFLRGDAQWAVPTLPSQAGSINLDDFTGTDDQRLDAAIAAVLVEVTAGRNAPLIRLPARDNIVFAVNGRAPYVEVGGVYTGLKIQGPGEENWQEADSSNDGIRNATIRFNFSTNLTTQGWFHNDLTADDLRGAYFGNLSIRGDSDCIFLTCASDSVTYQGLVLHNINSSGLRSLCGTPSQGLVVRALHCTGTWNINNCIDESMHFKGSDNWLWTSGMCLLDSPESQHPGGEKYHLRLNYFEKSQIANMFITAAGPWGAVWVDGPNLDADATSNLGAVTMSGCVIEGRNAATTTNNASDGALITMEGGQLRLERGYLNFAMAGPVTAPLSAQSPTAVGLIDVHSGYLELDGICTDFATGVDKTTVPVVYATGSGSKARVTRISTGSKGGSWTTNLPLVLAASSAVIHRDETVEGATSVALWDV
jgi:hypothetical protein